MNIHIHARIGAEELDHLKRDAANSPNRRARYHLHISRDDPVQEMIIAACRDTQLLPHRQAGRRKSYMLIQGSMIIFVFDDYGHILSKQMLTAVNQDCLSFDATAWHTIVPVTDFVVFKETVAGPYSPENTDWATWVEAYQGPYSQSLLLNYFKIMENGGTS